MFHFLVKDCLSFLKDGTKIIQVNIGGDLVGTEVTKSRELRLSKIYNYKKTHFILEETSKVIENENYIIRSIDSLTFAATKVQNISIKCKLFDLCPYAFAGCKFLRHVDLEQTFLSIIPPYCFYNSSKLSDIKLPHVVKTIGESAYALTAIEIFTSWQDLAEIGENCFGDSMLKEVNLIEGRVNTLSSHLFSGCKYLSVINFHSKLISIGSFVFAGTNITKIELKQSIKFIDKSAFSRIPRISSLSYAKTQITEIPDFCFELSRSLKHVEFSSNIQSIGVGSFSCTGIESISVPPSVKLIGAGAFRNCTNLSLLNISTLSISELPVSIFCGCVSLRKIQIPKGITIFSDWSYAGTAIKKFRFSQETTFIGKHCFDGCQNLEEVSMINSKITEIPKSAFKGCINLNTIRLPNAVTKIGKSAFKNTGITEYKAQSSIIEYGIEAFARNLKLETANFSQSEVTFLQTGLFKDCKSLSIFIPPSKFITFGIGVFENCGFVNLTISSSFQELNIKQYLNCLNLSKVDFSKVSFRLIPAQCFEGCVSLKRVILPKIKNTNLIQERFTLGEYSFRNCGFVKLFLNFSTIKYSRGTYADCLSLCNVTVTGKPKFRIPEECFKGCINLQYLHTPQFGHSYGRGCFAGCGFTILPISYYDEYVEEGIHMNSPNLEEVSYSFLNVVSIPARTFYGCRKLKKILIEANDLFIGDYALACTSIDQFVSDSVNAKFGIGVFENSTIRKFVFDHWIKGPIPARFFFGCRNLHSLEAKTRRDSALINITGFDEYSMAYTSSLVKPPNFKYATVIGAHAFECSGIFSATWGAHMQIMYNSAFAHCQNLTEFSLLGSKVQTIPNYAFYNTINLRSFLFPQFVSSSIMSYAFEKSGITDLYLPPSVTYVSGYVFANSAIRSIDIARLPMYTLGAGMFANCSNLQNVVLPKHIRAIGHSCFANSSIEEFAPDFELEYIGYKAFEGCTKLTIVNLERTLISNLTVSLFERCTCLKSVYLPLTLQIIYKRCFANSKLASFIAPSSLEIISESAFEGCTHLRTADLGYVSDIGPKAFRRTGLKKLVMPSVPYSIRSLAFAESTVERVELRNCAEMAEDSFIDSSIKYFSSTNSTFDSFNFDTIGLPNLEWISLPNNVKRVDGTIVGEAYYCGNGSVKGSVNGYIHLQKGFKGRFGETNVEYHDKCPGTYEENYDATREDLSWGDVALEDPRIE